MITGGDGFVGRWLAVDLRSAGHEPIPLGRDALDVTNHRQVEAALGAVNPDAVVHLAAVSYGPEASKDPAAAFRVNVGGTVQIVECVRQRPRPPAVLIPSSAEVYRSPAPEDLPLSETAPLQPRGTYGLSKAAQEGVALAGAAQYGLRLVITRSFNHVGPGQRPDFVVPAFALGALDLRLKRKEAIRVGNLDVRRDFTDVRDVARAYRLLLEGLAAGGLHAGGIVVNVASGRSIAIREILESLCRRAGVTPLTTVDPTLVRSDEPLDIKGDTSLLKALTGWQPEIGLDRTLDDVWEHVSAA
jgi:GDP-4-dehydro-6-deoxy-D-mannose reductase